MQKQKINEQLTVQTVRLTKKQIKQLSIIAEKYSFLNKRLFSKSEIIRRAVEQFISRNKAGV